MPRKRDRIDDLISKGAFVVKPKPTVTPDQEPVAEIAPEISIEDAARRLDRHFHTPQPQPEPSKAQPLPEYSEEFENPEHALGEIVDCAVVAWSTADPTRPGIGLARILGDGPRKKNGEKRTDGLLIRERNIVTEGTIRVGARIRATLAPPESGAHRFSLVQIEIYL